MVNKSVEAFRKLTLEMQTQVYVDALAELNAQADGLVTMMKSVVKHGPTGDLANSIHKEAGPTATIVKVAAGGAATTVQHGAGKSYDYARAVEFGTVKMHPEPFFFPTFRLMRKSMRSSMRRRISQRIKQYSAE